MSFLKFIFLLLESEKEFRAHANYIDLEFIKPFLHITKKIDHDFDIMIESKQKDLALLQLIDEISSYKRDKKKKWRNVTMVICNLALFFQKK